MRNCFGGFELGETWLGVSVEIAPLLDYVWLGLLGERANLRSFLIRGFGLVSACVCACMGVEHMGLLLSYSMGVVPESTVGLRHGLTVQPVKSDFFWLIGSVVGLAIARSI